MGKRIDYSGIPSLILVTSLFLLPVSCIKDAVIDNPEADNISQIIKISGEDANAATKTSLSGYVTSWVSTGLTPDQVGIYSPHARPTSKGSSDVTNRQHNATTSASSSEFSPEPGHEMYWGAANPHAFYAYYPYSSFAGNNAAAVPITLAAAQTQSAGNCSAHIGALDFMVANPMTVVTPGTSGEPTSVNFRYNHVFSVIEFQITGSGSLGKVWLSGLGTLAFSGGTIDITQTTPASGISYTFASQTGVSSDVIVTLSTPAVLDGTIVSKVYMMVNPCEPLGELYVGLYVSDGTSTAWKYIKKAASPGGGSGFVRGKKYIVAINADNATDAPTYSESSTAGTLIAGRFWAPVNAGYDAAHKYGLLYQWSRKYGQGYYHATLSPLETDPSNTSALASMSDGNFFGNAGTFYITNTDWCDASPQQTTPWDITFYNPCPAGWSVTSYAELAALNSTGSTWTAAGAGTDAGNPDGLAGRWFGGNHSGDRVGSIFLPLTGNRNYTGAAKYRGSYGYYWSTEASGASASLLNFGSGVSAAMFSSYRATGSAVRCVRDSG